MKDELEQNIKQKIINGLGFGYSILTTVIFTITVYLGNYGFITKVFYSLFFLCYLLWLYGVYKRLKEWKQYKKHSKLKIKWVER